MPVLPKELPGEFRKRPRTVDDLSASGRRVRQAAGLIDQLEFGTKAAKALSACQELEQRHRETAFMDIVLVGSDSIEAVLVAHANYFELGQGHLRRRTWHRWCQSIGADRSEVMRVMQTGAQWPRAATVRR